jgi:hypothetical protein
MLGIDQTVGEGLLELTGKWGGGKFSKLCQAEALFGFQAYSYTLG